MPVSQPLPSTKTKHCYKKYFLLNSHSLFAVEEDFLSRPARHLEFPTCAAASLPPFLEVGTAAREQQQDVLYHVDYPRSLPRDSPSDVHGVHGLHAEPFGDYLVGTLEVEPCRSARQAADGSAVVASSFLLHDSVIV